MYEIARLDLMIAYSCNIACKGCISLSDRRRSGIEPRANIEHWLSQWRSKITPAVATIFGGEPCLHPDLVEICRAVRDTWPSTTLRLITNGYLLHRFDARAWFDLCPLQIQVSVHRKDHEQRINQNIRLILAEDKPWKINQHGGDREHKQMSWYHARGIEIYKSVFKDFIVPYRDQQGSILPWNSDPALAHSICGSPSTPILFKGRLYKCPAVANVMDIIGRDSWCGYQPLDVDSDLSEFVAAIGKPESCCSQCPDLRQAQIIDHMNIKNVQVKNYH